MSERYMKTLECGCQVEIEIGFDFVDDKLDIGDAGLSFLCEKHDCKKIQKQLDDLRQSLNDKTGDYEVLEAHIEDLYKRLKEAVAEMNEELDSLALAICGANIDECKCFERGVRESKDRVMFILKNHGLVQDD